LAKKKVMVIKDIDRNDIDFISKTIGATPVAHIDQFKAEKLGSAALSQKRAQEAYQRLLR